MKFKKAFDVRAARTDFDMEVAAYLRRTGWRDTSNTPGCFWLWERKLDDGRTVLVSQDMALRMAAWLESDEDEATGSEGVDR